MKVILHTFGSYGDVHPFVGIGLQLKQRGHEVVLCTNEHFAPLAASVGLAFEAVISADQYHEAVHSPDFWHPRKGIPMLIRHGVAPTMRAAYPKLREHIVPGDTVVIGSSFAWAARLLTERDGVPGATVHLSPSFFRSNDAMPRNFRSRLPQKLPRGLRPFYWRIGDGFMDRVMLPELNPYRERLGLPPVRRLMDAWLHAPQSVLALFPEWFARPAAGWPAQTECLGFPLYDQENQQGLAPELESFLAAGSPPLVFTPGSAMGWGDSFFATSIEACRRLGRRGLLLTRYPDQLPAELPDGILHVPYAPFSLLLRHAAALVHHGGIGTMAQALRAGVPQLIRPVAFDQFDNADRAVALGVAREVSARAYRTKTVVRLLHQLLHDPAIAAASRRTAARFDDDRTLLNVCDEIEGLLPYQAKSSA